MDDTYRKDPVPSQRILALQRPRTPFGTTWLTSAALDGLERLFQLEQMNRVYRQIRSTAAADRFPQQVLEHLNVDPELRCGTPESIPREGPLVVVSNHPYGLIETIMLASMLTSVRPDVKVLANASMASIPEAAEYVIPVDVYGGAQSRARNMAALRKALAWVQAGGVLVLFPSGTVAHWHLRQRAVTEPEWPASMARLIRNSGASVLPVCFHGHNSPLFLVSGLIHPALRTAQIPRELLNKRNRRIPVSIGALQTPGKLARIEDDRRLAAYLRGKVELLLYRGTPPRVGRVLQRPDVPSTTSPQPIADAVPPELLAAELEALPPEQTLVEHDEFAVLCAPGSQLSVTLRELGRLRELTFRAEGEGTGKDMDLDRFDDHYEHLVLWNRKRREVVGAYRIGRVDEILRGQGVNGLYTRTLFRYEPRFFEQVQPAIELGRSFVRPEYQRSFAPLMLLWKGIARFVMVNRRYRYLIGPVSITSDYSPASMHLMMDYLLRHHGNASLRRLVRPKLPPRFRRRHPVLGSLRRWGLADDLDDVAAFISELEPDGKGVPVLLRQYLKLGGIALAFNRDPDFSNVLDVLLLVDLTRTEPRQLERYMGRQEARAYLANHGAIAQEPCARTA